MNDYYDTILRQRGLQEAFQVAADDAHKLRAQLEKVNDLLRQQHSVTCYVRFYNSSDWALCSCGLKPRTGELDRFYCPACGKYMGTGITEAEESFTAHECTYVSIFTKP